jgi:Fe-S cluster biogenesis protein NfuA
MVIKVFKYFVANVFFGIKMKKLDEKVAEIIEEIRPSLQADGGDIELIDVTQDGRVKVRLSGACVHCPMSTFTMALGVERILKERIPEVKRVEAV